MNIFNKNDILDNNFEKWEPLLPINNNKNLNNGMNDLVNMNRMKSDILLNNQNVKNKNPFFNKLFPPKKELVQFNMIDENNRFNVMSQEIMEKDEKIQELKNEILLLQGEIDETEKEKTICDSKIVENNILRQKLTEQYNITKEIPDYKYQIQRLMMQKKSNEETNQLLKRIVHKQQMIILETNEKVNYYKNNGLRENPYNSNNFKNKIQ